VENFKQLLGKNTKLPCASKKSVLMMCTPFISGKIGARNQHPKNKTNDLFALFTHTFAMARSRFLEISAW
jgi:hypothetical protein